MQWWVKMTPLATGALGALKYGQLRIVPERFNKTYTDWLENIHDWSISRQLWWGHRIPAWYCQDCGEMIVAREDPTTALTAMARDWSRTPTCWIPGSAPGCGRSARSAGQTTRPTCGYFYPTSVLETGYDILFFWVARMIMSGIHFTGRVPFHTVYLHGLVRDEQGRKMSKSLGNVIDPLEVMDEFGTDALRFTLATSSTPGQRHEAVRRANRGNRNFANKIWNAARFVIGQTEALGGGIPRWKAVQQNRWPTAGSSAGRST